MSDPKLQIARERFNLYLAELGRYLGRTGLSPADLEAMYYALAATCPVEFAFPIGVWQDHIYWLAYFSEQGGSPVYFGKTGVSGVNYAKKFEASHTLNPTGYKVLEGFHQRYSEEGRREICLGYALTMGQPEETAGFLHNLIEYVVTGTTQP